jgi:hypothetical protein
MKIVAWVVAFCSMTTTLISVIISSVNAKVCYVVPVLEECIPLSGLLIPVCSVVYVLALLALFPTKDKKVPKKIPSDLH